MKSAVAVLEKEVETRRIGKAHICPYLYLWPVAVCHGKNGRVYIQTNDTVEDVCTKLSYQGCPIFIKKLTAGSES